MRALFLRAALVTVCALFAAVALAGPAAARPAPARSAAPAPARSADPRPHPVLLAKSYTAPLVIVRSGDSLSVIAKRACHRAGFWPELWWANRHRVHNPDLITPGERLRVPSCAPVRKAHAAAALEAIPKPPPAAPAAAGPATPPAGSAASPAQAASYSGGSGFQACVIARESGGNPSAVNPTSGAGGLYQFLPSTWAALGHSGLPENASVAEQNQAFAQEYAQSGTSAWAPYDGC